VYEAIQIREYLYFVDRFNDSALDGTWCISGFEAHTNFAGE
jgi:hypothetical protein